MSEEGKGVESEMFRAVLEKAHRVLSGEEEVPDFTDLVWVRDRLIHRHENVYYLGECGVAGCQSDGATGVSKSESERVRDRPWESDSLEDDDEDDNYWG